MGLQKGRPGYPFRWLVPVFSLLSALPAIGYSIALAVVTFFSSLVLGNMRSYSALAELLLDDYPDLTAFAAMIRGMPFFAVFFVLIALAMTINTIMTFVMNKKGMYLASSIISGISGLIYLLASVLSFASASNLRMYNGVFNAGVVFSWAGSLTLIGGAVMAVAAFILCVMIFSLVAIPKCEYETTFDQRNMAGQNLTYVGFDAGQNTMFHEHGVQGRIDPYAPQPPEPPEPPEFTYVPRGEVGKVTGVLGMYAGASFTIENGEEIVIGRDPRVAQIVIGEGAQSVSREHCRISYDASSNSYRVLDKSKNGTFSLANKSRLPHNTYTTVPAGTEIYLGDKSNTFRLG